MRIKNGIKILNQVSKITAVFVASFLISLNNSGAALALAPPVFNPTLDKPPPDGTPGPTVTMEQSTVCGSIALTLQGSNYNVIQAQLPLRINEIHKLATGRGIKVAVIDTGVNPVPRLRNLVGGGDYVGNTDGLQDCDTHGTLVAGIIGAQPSPNDPFVGMAPDATIISIRQYSAAYRPKDYKSTFDPIYTLSEAIVHAADLGAQVINISLVSCYPAEKSPDYDELKGALHYAAVTKDAVVVVASGNQQPDVKESDSGGSCGQNPDYNPDNPDDPRNWAGVTSVSLPSAASSDILSVGGTDDQGQWSPLFIAGPWVSVAGPALGIVSLNPDPKKSSLTNGELTQQGGESQLAGTSFAAPYVSGLAALIRQKFPYLNSRQVIERIMATAHHPARGINNEVGAGFIDPLAALTADISPSNKYQLSSYDSVHLPEEAPPPPKDHTARDAGVIGLIFAFLCLVLIGVFNFLKTKDPGK